jgi:hypothetical protein
VFETSPVRVLVKLPEVVPSLVLLLATVGLGVIAQQTPRAVSVASAATVTLPPLIAEIDVISLTAVVVRVASGSFSQPAITTRPMIIKNANNLFLYMISEFYVKHLFNTECKVMNFLVFITHPEVFKSIMLKPEVSYYSNAKKSSGL